MVYYSDGTIVIRNMEETDAQVFTDEERVQGWHPDISKYLTRIRDQAEGKCVSLTAEYEGHPAGYVNVYIAGGPGGAFSGKGLPEIVDFGVLEKYQRRGIGSKLMDAAEQIAAQYADTVWLGVGLHSGYGSAQRMYVKRGYIPDGTGVWYQGRPCEQYETEIENDDSLQLFFSKKLRPERKTQMKTKHVTVEPYNKAWADHFAGIRNEIGEAMGGLALRIEHVGSTSVPGLSAKPIIDIDVVIRDESVLEEAVRMLETIGYRHEGNLGIEGREAFRYDGKDHLQKHHLYVCTQDSAELKRHIAFRDYLRSHPEAVREYSRIKEEGAVLYPDDIEKYIGHKSPFIERIYREIGL